jgi:uncharacterized protein
VTGPEHVTGPEPAGAEHPDLGRATSAAATPPPPVPPPAPPPAVPPSAGPIPPPPPADAPGARGVGPVSAAPSIPAPRLDGRERSLDPRMVHVWRAFSALWLVPLLLLGTLTGVLAFDGWGWVIGLGLLVLLAVSLLWYQPARYARWRWCLTDLALELRRGVVVHQQETVPYFRIQQIDVIQGPVDRLLKLAALQVTTASASGSVALPGIPAADAPQVRAELLARAAEAVREHPGEVADAV